MKPQQQWITVDLNNLGHYSDGINQIYRGEIDGFWIKQVFSPAEMQKVKETLTKTQAELSNLLSTQRYGKLLGAILTENGSDTTKYFRDAALVRQALKKIFPRDYEATIESVFSQLSGGRKVTVAHQKNNYYSSAQVRFTYPNTGGIRLHKGNEFIGLDGFEGLHEIVKLKDCLSYYLVISPPESGGELVLYDDLPEELTVDKEELDLENSLQRRYNPGVGDLIVFHGACIWHAVSEVKGSQIRYSIGGFLGLSHDEQTIYYWA